MFSFGKILTLIAIIMALLTAFRLINTVQNIQNAKPAPKRRPVRGSASKPQAQTASNTIVAPEPLIECSRCGVFHPQGKACPECKSQKRA